MALILVTGGPSSGKTDVLYNVARATARGAVPTILLPSAPDVRRACRELVVRDGLVGVRIEQVDRFLSTTWELRGDGRQLITPLQRSALLHPAIANSRLPELTVSASTPGFLSLLERLASLQSRSPRPAGSDLGAAIAETLLRYHESLVAHGLAELSEATEILAQRVASEWFEGPLLANRFDDLTQSQEHFFVAAAQAGGEVWLAVTGGTDSPATAATSGLVERLRASADREVRAEGTRNCKSELLDLERSLFAGKGPVEARGGVILSVAYGEEAEADRIAAEVLESRAAGVDFAEIAVIYRDTRRHHLALKRAFSEARIPADFDVRVRFSETPLGLAVLALLDFVATGSRTLLVGFLSSGYVGLNFDDVDELDALWRRRIGEGDAHKMITDLDMVGADARRFIGGAVSLAREGVQPGNVEAWKDLAGEMLARAHGRRAPLLGDDAAGDAQAHRKLCEAVDDLNGLGEIGIASIGLRDVLASAWIAPDGANRHGRVQVMDVERVRGRHFRHVIMGGLVGGEFPRALDEGVFESGPLSTRLDEQAVSLPRSGGLDSERLLFYLAVTRARDRLVLSRQESDSDGRPLRPSAFLEEVLAAYETSAGEEVALPQRVLTFADLGLHPSAPDIARRALRSVALSENGGTLPPVTRSRARFAVPPETITDAGLLESLASKNEFSATELERYLRCPYSWFYMGFLGPEPLGESSESLLAGTLAHKVLRDFYTALPDVTGDERVTPGTENKCLSLCDAVIDKVFEQRLEPTRLEHRLLAERVRRLSRRLVRRDATFLPGFAPKLLEWSFGLDTGDPEDFGGFILKGRVDRVDVAGDRLVIVDYKTGHAIPVAHFEKEGVLQAPLYAEVARRRLGGRIAGTFYRSLSATARRDLNRGLYDAQLVTGSELMANDAEPAVAEVIADAVERARSAVEGIRSGRVDRRPLSERACAYCGARSWCKEALAS